jgi:hypothetical protein
VEKFVNKELRERKRPKGFFGYLKGRNGWNRP